MRRYLKILQSFENCWKILFTMKASIVINAKNALCDIEEILNSLLNQTFSDFEVIVVDSESTDGTIEVVKKYIDIFKDRLILHIEECSIGRGRQIGAELARTELIFYLDSDCIPPKDWFERFYNDFVEKGCDILFGKVKTYPDKGFFYRCVGALYESVYNEAGELNLTRYGNVGRGG